MKYFTKEFNQFFKDLAANNNKDWFQEHKKRYELHVKNPFYKFMEDTIVMAKKTDAEIDLLPKNCVGRINRDIRFSKDKTPYNTHFTGFVSKGGRKDSRFPGMAFRFSPEGLWIMGGCYAPSKEQLDHIRQAILNNPKAFNKVIYKNDFVEKFNELTGEKNKRAPKEYMDAATKEPLIMNKQFYYVAKRPVKLITSNKLLEEIKSYWMAAKPVNDYFSKIINP